MELNHSSTLDRSMFRDREMSDTVFQRSDEQCRFNESGSSRLSPRMQQPNIRSNAHHSRPPSIISKNSVHSLALSREKINIFGDDGLRHENMANRSKLEEIKLTLLLLALFCLCSIVLSSLSIQLLMVLSSQQTINESSDTVGHVRFSFAYIAEVTSALSTFVIVFNITCLLVCSLQCLVVIQLLKVPRGDERALKYLKECSISRHVAFIGFFVSMPIFLVAVILYVVLKFSQTAAITAIVILTVACFFCVLTLVNNSCNWKIEKSRALAGLPVFDMKHSRKNIECPAQELSTLV